MLKTVFTINLNVNLLPGLIAVGKFDSINPCIVAATSSDKLLIHKPAKRGSNSQSIWSTSANSTDIIYLNINQTIKSLTVGKLATKAGNESLILGTPTSILVYDVINNKDVFYREITDGVNAVCVGKIGTIDDSIAIAGGNCAIQGFNENGEEKLWTITGDNITCLELADIDCDGANELIVGSEDYDIRIFKEDVIWLEINETDAVKFICKLNNQCFGYALVNGTVGVYYKKERLWRIKSKNEVACIYSYDVNDDGIMEIITGWSNGKIDVRNIENGEIIFKDKFNHPIAGIMSADYNLDTIDELIVCTISGEVKGYAITKKPDKPQTIDLNAEQEIIRDLMKKKQNLQLELRNIESSNNYYDKNVQLHGKASTEDDEYGTIPVDTQLKSALLINVDNEKPHLQLNLQTTNDTIIKAVVIFAEGIFKGESYVVHPPEVEVSNVLPVPLRPLRDVAIDLHVKSLVGYKNSHHYHVFELSRHLPKFSMYLLLDKSDAATKVKPESFVNFTLNEKIGKIIIWFNTNFLLTEEITLDQDLDLTFTSLRDNRLLTFTIKINKICHVTIRTENIELAGDLVQSIASEFNLTELHSSCQFYNELVCLKNLIKKVQQFQSVRQQLKAEIADNSLAIKTLIIRAEDARLLGEWKILRQFYIDLNALNKELNNEYHIRSQNHTNMIESLKKINLIIQKSANLRVGPLKAHLIQACRSAIKNNNLDALEKIVNIGNETSD